MRETLLVSQVGFLLGETKVAEAVGKAELCLSSTLIFI